MANRERLLQTLIDLIGIDSPSGEEDRIDAEISARLEALGFQVLSRFLPEHHRHGAGERRAGVAVGPHGHGGTGPGHQACSGWGHAPVGRDHHPGRRLQGGPEHRAGSRGVGTGIGRRPSSHRNRLHPPRGRRAGWGASPGLRQTFGQAWRGVRRRGHGQPHLRGGPVAERSHGHHQGRRPPTPGSNRKRACPPSCWPPRF